MIEMQNDNDKMNVKLWKGIAYILIIVLVGNSVNMERDVGWSMKTGDIWIK